MKRISWSRDDKELGLDRPITRRDFLGATLVGSGAGLLAMNAPGCTSAERSSSPPPSEILGPDWTGPGGVGDYARSNGNTHEVVNAAHSVRDRKFDPASAVDTGEEYDLVVVGGGFSGFGAAYTFNRETSRGSCLVLDNHAMFGGEAKQNEILVDGYHLYGPQGSNSFIGPDPLAREAGFVPEIWDELELPDEFAYQELSGTAKDIRFAWDNFGPMMKWPERASIGYHYGQGENGGEWVIDGHRNRFEGAPIPNDLRNDLNAVLFDRAKPNIPSEGWQRWLDTMTYQDFLVKELGVSPKVLYDYIDPYFAAASFGVSGDAISAYGAYALQMPGMGAFIPEARRGFYQDRSFVSFPGGNAAMLRHLVKSALPEAIAGGESFSEVAFGETNFGALDSPENRTRIRLGATVVRVAHDGPPETAKTVLVTYSKDGRLSRVRAKAAVVAAGGWIARYILADLPAEIQSAYSSFHHAPMLIVNVALRNWHFMEKLGISAARWFEGFGWFANIRQPMIVEGATQPLDPSKPAILTLYVPFVDHAGKRIETQIALGRTDLLAKSYREFEVAIRHQLAQLFGEYGFDPREDIAGIILNRWGHAYVAPQPGFYFGQDGNPPAREVVRKGYGRISFGHSELTGVQAWSNGIAEGGRAAREAIARAV